MKITFNEVFNEVFQKTYVICYKLQNNEKQNAPLIQFFYIPQQKV